MIYDLLLMEIDKNESFHEFSLTLVVSDLAITTLLQNQPIVAWINNMTLTNKIFHKWNGGFQYWGFVHFPIRVWNHNTQFTDQNIELVSSFLFTKVSSFPAKIKGTVIKKFAINSTLLSRSMELLASKLENYGNCLHLFQLAGFLAKIQKFQDFAC